MFKYYCQFNENVLSTEADSFPCSLKNTSFRSIDTFKTFLKFVMPEICGIIRAASAKDKAPATSQLESVEVETLRISDDNTPVLEHPKIEFPPLIVTADGILQPHSDGSESKVIKTCFTNVFPKCLKLFLHPELSDIGIPKDFILSPSEKDNAICFKRIEMCFSSILPMNLYNVPCVECPDLKQLKLSLVLEMFKRR